MANYYDCGSIQSPTHPVSMALLIPLAAPGLPPLQPKAVQYGIEQVMLMENSGPI
jgi:hypothetical protein